MRLIIKIPLAISAVFLLLSNCIHRVVRAIDSFIVVMMTPKELCEHGKAAYEKSITEFASANYVKQGLLEWEKYAVEKYASRKGTFLILGSGGGREAIALAKMGFRVIGIDSSEKMIKKAKSYASKEGLEIEFRKGDFFDLSPPGELFDYGILSCLMYSSIPTRSLRVKALSQIRAALGEGGMLMIHFCFDPTRKKERLFKLRRFIAKAFGGNREYLEGDSFSSAFHFLRHFTSEAEVAEEAKEARFIVKEIGGDYHAERYAVLQKSA